VVWQASQNHAVFSLLVLYLVVVGRMHELSFGGKVVQASLGCDTRLMTKIESWLALQISIISSSQGNNKKLCL